MIYERNLFLLLFPLPGWIFLTASMGYNDPKLIPFRNLDPEALLKCRQTGWKTFKPQKRCLPSQIPVGTHPKQTFALLSFKPGRVRF